MRGFLCFFYFSKLKSTKFFLNLKYLLFQFLQCLSIYLVDLQGSSLKLHLSMMKDTPPILFWPHLKSSKFSRSNDFEDCEIKDNQTGQFLLNIVGGASFLIQTTPAISMPSLLYVAKHYPDERTPFVLKPSMAVFLLALA